MEVDEDMFLVIVGDEEGTADPTKPIQIKEELVESNDNIANLIRAAEEQGEIYEIEVDSFKQEEEYLEEEFNLDENSSFHDISDEENDECGIPRKTSVEANVRRRAMRNPWEQKSFVKELKQEYPELQEDKDLLIQTLAEIMRSVKAPELPQDYFFMNGIDFECSKCGSISTTIPAISRHYQEKHGPRYLICFACGVDFRSTTNLYKHEKCCRAKDAVIVLKARARVVGKKGRSRPFLLKPSEIAIQKKYATPKSFKCSLCSASFTSRYALESHEHLHRGERPYICNKCPNAYTSKWALYRHIQKHTDIQFICDHCNRSFKVKAALVSHMDTHRPLKKYPCDECGRRFAQKMALMLHVNKIHRNLPPPCACQICPRRYPRMSLLNQHMRRAHGLSLMTRMMFLKSLPNLDAKQVQEAKIVFKPLVEGTPEAEYYLMTEDDPNQYREEAQLNTENYDDSSNQMIELSIDNYDENDEITQTDMEDTNDNIVVNQNYFDVEVKLEPIDMCNSQSTDKGMEFLMKAIETVANDENVTEDLASAVERRRHTVKSAKRKNITIDRK